MEPTPRTPAPLLAILTLFNVILAVWSMVSTYMVINTIKLLGAPEVWSRVSPEEQAVLGQLSALPSWLLYGTVASGMVKATLFVLSAYGYFLRQDRLGRWGGTLLAAWLLAEQGVLVAAVGAVGLGVVVYVAYALFTLWVIHGPQREAFAS
jgi:hypothetical protein